MAKIAVFSQRFPIFSVRGPQILGKYAKSQLNPVLVFPGDKLRQTELNVYVL